MSTALSSGVNYILSGFALIGGVLYYSYTKNLKAKTDKAKASSDKASTQSGAKPPSNKS
jgi:hypothetical protein